MLEFSEPFSCEVITKVYILISSSLSYTTQLSNENFTRIERIVLLLFNATSSYSNVKECCRYLFSKKALEKKLCDSILKEPYYKAGMQL